MNESTVRVGTGRALVWPQACVLCLGSATKEGFQVIGGKRVPYCDNCHAKVQRLSHWKDNTFGIAGIIGAVWALLVLIGICFDEGWLELFRLWTWLRTVAGGMIFGGIVYVIIWLLLLLPLRVILHSKVANPGVKIVKTEEPGVTTLWFSNPEYAVLFREANGLE
jgi:hypothetical protein